MIGLASTACKCEVTVRERKRCKNCQDFAIGSSYAVHNVECSHNPGHEHFIPIKSLSPSKLPPPFQSDTKWADMLKVRSAATVKITVRFTSINRTDDIGWRECVGTNRSRWGTGTVFWSEPHSNQIECPFQDCRLGGEPHRVYGPFHVVTVTHLVFDETEAEATTVEFFDDDPGDSSNVCEAQVFGFQKEPPGNNRSILSCVTHDRRIPERLDKATREINQLVKQLQEPDGCSMVVMISHPHGMSKCVSFGQLLRLEENGLVKTTRDGQMRLRKCNLSYSTPSCLGSGGGSVTLWKRGKRAFAPHSKSLGKGKNQSAVGWVWID